MHRFFLPAERCTGSELTLDAGDSHHAARILRLAAGAEIEVLDGSGGCLDCRVIAPDRRALKAVVLRRRHVPAPPPVAVAPSLLKGRAMDFLVQKATELGAAAILPLATMRAVAQVAPAEAAAKVEGWRSTAREACKQCGNPWLPRIDAPRGLEQFLRERPPGLLLVASLREDARRCRGLFEGAANPRDGVILVLGPEGDFAPEEEAAFRSAGAVPVSLGPLVLRAETAAIAGLAVLQHELAAARE